MSDSTIATREAFLKPIVLNVSTFECRLGTIRMRELSKPDHSKEYVDWLKPDGKIDKDRDKVALSKLVTLCVVDENNKRILTEEDIETLESYPTALRTKLHTEALLVNGAMETKASGDTLGK